VACAGEGPGLALGRECSAQVTHVLEHEAEVPVGARQLDRVGVGARGADGAPEQGDRVLEPTLVPRHQAERVVALEEIPGGCQAQLSRQRGLGRAPGRGEITQLPVRQRN
jgi:hypothetical protein